MLGQEWLRGVSKDLRSVLEDVTEWRRGLHLSGSEARYDPTPGFYGNPKAKTVFVAEIPEVGGIDESINQRIDRGENSPLWQSNWNVSPGDRLLRMALRQHGFIPPGTENQPHLWRCWITDFVKCPMRDSFWHPKKKHLDDAMAPVVKAAILDESAALLARELAAIRPKKIVIMGANTQGYFKNRKYEKVLGIPRRKWRFVPHYARKNGRESAYLEGFSVGLKRRVL